ncbi:uncharacterized protein LOC129278037 [Lytechinus pictus]|uniref:uncharacterized protein LOC129278037 n=1 Tax=Lytechinus pictus TaxID=7653 RepID=UPI0030B9ED81
MSEVKEEDHSTAVETPEDNNTVQVVIEPATPRDGKRESGSVKEILKTEDTEQTETHGKESSEKASENEVSNDKESPAADENSNDKNDNSDDNTQENHSEVNQPEENNKRPDEEVTDVNGSNTVIQNLSENKVQDEKETLVGKVVKEGDDNTNDKDSAPGGDEGDQTKSESSNVEESAPHSDTEHGIEESSHETIKEDNDNQTEGSSCDSKKDGDFQVTTDILTEDMEAGQKGHESSISGSVSDKERTVKTPESIAVSVDLPVNNLAPSQSRMSNRPVTAESEFVYNEHDFPTPDYDIYGPTPTTAGSDKRQFSPSKREGRTASRGEGAKSVTFAEDVSIGGEADDKDPTHVLDKEEPDQDNQDKEMTGDEKQEEEEGKTTEQEDEESRDIFPTAVSEEKIEEAKKKQEGLTKKESLAIELFGASKFEPESMEDVITKKAFQHFEVGCRLMDDGDFGQAVISLDKALNLLPKEVKFYLMRGEAYLQLCDFQSAILNLKKACVLQPDNHEYYARLAFVYYFQGQSLFDQCLFPEALESFSRAAEMRPEIIAYHTRSIACLAALQRHGECLALVNKRLETERNNPDLYIMRARLHQLFRNTTLCYYDLKDALALNPDQEEAKILMKELERKAEENRNHAIRLQLQGKFKDSLTKITIAIEMNPSVSDYHLQRGALHRRLHDYNAAIDDFLLAMDKTEHNEYSNIYTDAQRQLLLTYNDFAVECFSGNHFEEAILLLNKALKGEKREKGLYINRGDCFFRLQELHFALADYHQASELDPSDAGIRSRVAAIHNQFGLQDYEEHSYQDAESRFTIAIQHNPKHGAFYISRCKVRLMMENQSGARQDFLMALHLDSSNTEILTLMPRIYPGKSVGDVMRTKHAKEAKIAADNAVITASPIVLPSMNSSAQNSQEDLGATSKRVNFDPELASDTVVPPLKYCMNEQDFNRALTKQKRKISNHVKSLLNDRGTMRADKLKLNPIPPPRPYEVRGGHWKNPEPAIKPGWRTFSLGVGLMD